LQREADPAGLVAATPQDVALALPGKVSAREVESALRVLQQADAIRNESESPSRVLVRLIATPERIKRELSGEFDADRELLRALWRAAGKQLESGAIVDLDALPPVFGGAAGMLAALDGLQARQFVTFERAGGGARLTDPRRPLARFQVDWAQLDRRRRAEMSQLDAMQRYAYHTGCRRQFVLRYFGDAAAGTTAMRCGGCDNCLGIKHEVSMPVAPAARPRKTAAPKPPREDRQAKSERVAAARVESAELVLGPDDAPMFAALRALRSEIARAEQVPAYVVFPDRTLAEFAVRRPRTLAAMSAVRGVGPAKLEKYGERFLDVIRRGEGTEAA
jgi:ATP-dependent DNA helicase RecQ